MARIAAPRPHLAAAVALVLSGLAVALAVLFALGPADTTSTTHTWETSATPGTAVFEPLILVASTPDEISVAVPCRSDSTTASQLMFSTAPDDEGLTIMGSGGRLSVSVGGDLLGTASWHSVSDTSECSHTVAYGDESWLIQSPNGDQVRSQGAGPVVVHLAVDASGPVDGIVRATVETQPHGSSPSAAQWVTGVLAVVLAVSATGIALRTISAGARTSDTKKHRSRGPLRIGLADAAVATTTALWMAIESAHYDDGWMLAIHRGFEDVGRFTSYYMNAGLQGPLGYWSNWLAHWWTITVHSPVALRLLPAVLIIAGWTVARLTVTAVAPLAWRRPLVRGVLAGAYLVGTTAWLMTLRVEPTTNLLCAIAVLGVVMFLRRRSAIFLVVSLAAAALSVAAHPEGIVALAPVIVVLPWLVQWFRESPGRVIPLLASALSIGALGIVVLFLDSDVGLKLDAISGFESSAHSYTPADEALRYLGLSLEHGGTVLRRLSVTLGGVAIVMFVGRVWRRPPAIVDTAGWSLIVGTVLLSTTPSKWVWHFGALVGLISVVLAVEFGALIAARRAPIRRAAAAIAVVAAATFAWGGTQGSNELDLITLQWVSMPLVNTPAWMWAAIIALITLALVALRRFRSWDSLAVGTVLSTTLISALAITSTAGMLIADSIATDGWTLAKQNTQALLGNNSCGIADFAYATETPGAIRFESIMANSDASNEVAADAGFPAGSGDSTEWISDPIEPERSFHALGLPIYWSGQREMLPTPTGYQGSTHAPWQHLWPHTDRVYLQAARGIPGTMRLAVQFGRRQSGAVVPVGLAEIPNPSNSSMWRSIEVDVPEDADAARIVAVDEAVGRYGTIAFRGLFALDGPPSDMARFMADPMTSTFIPPQLGLYFPCASQPSIAGGIAEGPNAIVYDVLPNFVFRPAWAQRDYQPAVAYPLVIYVDETWPG